MNLSKLQREAILQVGNTASGHEFLTTEVLEELLAMGLIYWRAPDNLDFTPVGEKVFDELEGQ
jgi:hypothetical protein